MLLKLACLAAMAVSGAAQAQVTQSYSYDGNGRLTGVSTTGGSGANTASYAYDDANNRTGRTQSGSSAYALLLELPARGVLRPDHALVSADRRFTLALRASGRLELWDGDAADSRVELQSALSSVFDVDASLDAAVHLAVAPEAVLSLTDAGDLIATDKGQIVWSLAQLSNGGTR